ncbi:MAG TPA: glycerol-3-phosphate 1-O-acyltransferase PlsY [Candidatus Udaeobacter sp.]|nr:glycerol-3-phosphate 1-O-acyltransferase PlsY [Candidatus Udaeobacter sp.]
MDLRRQLLLAPRSTAQNENTILTISLAFRQAAMEIIVMIFSYLLGSIPTGYIVGALAGIDIRKVGSGNVGATNVARALGRKPGLLTLSADVAKGFVPVFVAIWLGLNPTVVALVASAAFLGHLYPVFLRFQGGKGVATAFGVLLALAPMATLILMGVFILVAVSTRLVSLSSIVTAWAAPITLWSLSYAPTVIATGVFFALLITARHRDNIQRLLVGTEPRFGSR